MTWVTPRTTTRWGVTLCAPEDTHVVERMVCYNELGARRRGAHWKRRKPDHVVRVFSLLPGDTSPPIEIGNERGVSPVQVDIRRRIFV